ncbi:MAG: hypothetical protein C4526_07180 [Nitrospiraceae bacterium]|nr:MAG: hypothetical protein C4526_07180 [Nitrospiraceae bacterium]
MNSQSTNDQEYLTVVLNAIRVCADYRPKLGHSAKDGYTLQQFQEMYRNDPFYSWVGLDNPLMYAAHKAAGGMTSIYRQIGIGCENLFRKVLQDSLNLTEDDVKWSYTVKKGRGKTRTLSLDARIQTDIVPDPKAKTRIQSWIAQSAKSLDVNDRIASSLQGIVFEVRQGYKSKDSKRQNADIANAATAYTKGYLPCVAILSLQIDEAIALRYRNEKWMLLTGSVAGESPLTSIYSFMSEVIGYDLAAFFQRHSDILKAEVNNVLTKLLSTK